MKIAQQTRDEVVRLYSQRVPIREIMRRFEVSRSSIYNFLKIDKMHISSNGCMAITFRQITSMESELNRLRQENEILKTCGCYIEAPLTERLSCIEKLSDKYGSSTFYDRNEQKKEKNKETELKKTDIGPIFESPQNKNRRNQCRSICTIRKRYADFNRKQ